MVEQNDIKRQVRYKDSIYDILKDIIIGNHKYLIIGKGSESKFFDIDFVEQKIDNGKIKYVSPSSSYHFNPELDFQRIQSQSLMSYIVNDIKDNINQNRLINSELTIKYIDEISKIIDTNNDIKGFFQNNSFYDNENKFEESIRILIGYYEKNIKEYNDSKRLPTGEVIVSDETVKEIYSELENTQNFGVSAIYDYRNKNNDSDYIVDPTNNIFIEQSAPVLENEIFQELVDTKEKLDSSGEEVKEQKQSNMSFQERLYLENEQKLREKGQNNIQTELGVKTKTLALRSSKMNNAAYITISTLLYVVGSFELLLAVILLAKYL